MDSLTCLNGQFSDTAKALQLASNTLSKARDTSNKTALLITAGKRNTGEDPKAVANQMRQKKIHVFG